MVSRRNHGKVSPCSTTLRNVYVILLPNLGYRFQISSAQVKNSPRWILLLGAKPPSSALWHRLQCSLAEMVHLFRRSRSNRDVRSAGYFSNTIWMQYISSCELKQVRSLCMKGTPLQNPALEICDYNVACQNYQQTQSILPNCRQYWSGLFAIRT